MRAALVTVVLVALATGAASAGAAGHKLVLYTVASGVEFINTADDRARGTINNPFTPALNGLRPNVSEAGNGPFAGDVAVYSFEVYANAKLRKRAGNASYTCYFNYLRHALCMAYYELSGGSGTILAAGPVDFNATGFRLVVTGGTRKYLGVRGEVTALPSARNAQRVELLLLD
jgi:hypothetical protein